MVTFPTNETAYVFSDDYDYRSYLEKRSHFDRVEIAVDKGIKELIASNGELAKVQLQASSQLAADIQVGFEMLVVSLDNIERSVDKLSSVCANGFARIDLSLNNIDGSLQELISIARTPDQTWALEQFDIARDAFRKSLIEESLDYINRAILGYRDRSGFRLEHRFYMLRGLIRLGNYKNFSTDIVDLDAARDDFLLAAKYAEHDNLVDCGRSFGLAGWASYCSGNMTAAEKFLRRSVEINHGDNQSKFDLSKVLFHLGQNTDAVQYFSEVLRGDWKYGIRAGSDSDFIKNRKIVEECIGKYRSEQLRSLLEIFVQYDRLDVGAKVTILSRHGYDLDQYSISFFKKLRHEAKTYPIADIISAIEPSISSLEKIKEGILSGKRKLQEKANNLRKRTDFSYNSSERNSVVAIVFTLGVALFLGVNSYLKNGDLGADMGTILSAALGLFMLSIIFYPVGRYIVGPIYNSVIGSIKSDERSGLASELEVDAKKL